MTKEQKIQYIINEIQDVEKFRKLIRLLFAETISNLDDQNLDKLISLLEQNNGTPQ